MILLSAAQSRELDRLSRESYGIDSYVLMTRAGESVARFAMERFAGEMRAGALVVAGKGNNGGDGFVAARKLAQGGIKVGVALVGRLGELKGDAARACADYQASGGAVREISDASGLEAVSAATPGVIIDALFGTGLNAEVRDLPRAAIESINALGAAVVTVDIPSGINSDTGAVMGLAVKASLTVTFGYAKFGHASYPGAAYCGDLEVADIGFADAAIKEIAPGGLFVELSDAARLVRPRPPDSHKGSYGHTLVVAGSLGKSGAAILAARGALRAGAGLVTAAIPESIALTVAAGQPELMTEPMPERGGHFEAKRTAELLGSLVEGKSALIFGPGVGVSEDTKELTRWLITEATTPERPLVLDADGLNALAQLGRETVREARGAVVMMPHPGEMARLLGTKGAAVNADRISAARLLAESAQAWVVLKGARSVVAGRDGTLKVNSSGNPGMASGGMGDALSGIVGALLGQGMAPAEATELGVFLHGFAADRLAKRVGPWGYLAGDLIDELPRAIAAFFG